MYVPSKVSTVDTHRNLNFTMLSHRELILVLYGLALKQIFKI